MKQKLRLGDCYALSKHNRKELKLRYISLLAVATTMCLYAVKQVSAQEAEPAATAVSNVKPLQIGHTIPEYLWQLPLQVVNHPPAGGKNSLTLNDYRDQLIILDFWATWCKPCISSLYKLNTLQKQFADELTVIPTTYEAKEKVSTFLANKGWSLPSAVGDTILKKYFPHQSIPHQVWIKSGRVEAIVGSDYAKADIIRNVLAGKHVAFNHKIEVPFDKMKPLFINGNGGNGSNLLYQSVISGRLQANVSGGSRPSPNEIFLYNRTVEGLFIEAIRSNGNLHLSELNAKGYVVYEVPDSLRYRISSDGVLAADDDSLLRQWLNANTYCYNLVLPEESGYAEVGKRMYQDLSNFFSSYLNLKVSYEERKVRALALVKLGNPENLSTKGGPRATTYDAGENVLVVTNAPISALTRYISRSLQRASRKDRELNLLPIVDETGIEHHIDLIVKADFSDLNAVREGLAIHGLGLVEKSSVVKMIVFSNNDTE